MTWETIGGMKLAITEDFRFGTDALLLTHFAAPRKAGETVCDLGTGCGIIPFLLIQRTPAPGRMIGVDIQKEAIDLARRSAEQNGCENLTFLNLDWKHPAAIAPTSTVDRVICNPPYFPETAGKVSDSAPRRIARTETGETLNEIAHAAAFLLKTGGKLCLCHRPERLCDLVCTLRAHRLEPKRLVAVQQRAGKDPWLILVEAVKGAKPGITLSAPFILEDENGKTALYKEIYQLYGGDTYDR